MENNYYTLACKGGGQMEKQKTDREGQNHPKSGAYLK